MGRRKNWADDLSDTDSTWANWKMPVRVQVSAKRSQLIENPADALLCISHWWPNPAGEQAEFARKSCSLVLRRKVKTEDAYDAFVAAAVEARILLQSAS